MTAYDRDALAEEALANLLVVGSGQSSDSEDKEFVKSRIDAVSEGLIARGVVTIPDLDDIEPRFFLPLAELLANECAPKFGQPKSIAVRDDAEDRLKLMVQYTGNPPVQLKTDVALRTRRGLSLARWTQGW